MEPLLVGSTTDSTTGAEVPIPVITDDEKGVLDVDESSLPTPLGNVTNFASRQLPTISVTKPPAPMPVDLPSPSTLTPEDETGPRFPPQDDIEGRAADGPVPLTSVPPRVARSRSPSPKLTLETTHTALVESPETTPVTSPSATTDLLANAAPFALAGPSQPVVPLAELEPAKSGEESPVLVDAADAPTEQDPDTTIRLVGAGGISGTVAEEPLQAEGVLVEQHESEDDVAAEVASIRSVDSKASTTSKKHSRNKSSLSSGLKKLGKLGGKRRTDSVASVEAK